MGRRQNSTVIDGLTFSSMGPSIAVTGPSGSGKSTLLRVLSGLQTPKRGRASLDGHVIAASRSTAKLNAGVSVVYQQDSLVQFLSVSDNIRLASELKNRALPDASILEALTAVDLGEFGSRFPSTLSGGERQRVALARALATRPSLLLADEPTGALDSKNSIAIGELLRELAASHSIKVVVATHDERIAEMMADRLDLAEHS